jgi:hypothetical protein
MMKKIIQFFEKIANSIWSFFLNRVVKKINKLIKNIENEITDEILELLLKAIRLFIKIDKKYARNIEGFNAKYTIRTKKGKVAASAIFANHKMKVKDKPIPDSEANVIVEFKDSKSLWEFLMSGSPDIFSFVLDSKLSYEGNMNYLLKFAYMAKALQLKFQF